MFFFGDVLICKRAIHMQVPRPVCRSDRFSYL